MNPIATSVFRLCQSLRGLSVVVLGCIALNWAWAGPTMSWDELDSYIETYYLHPNPDRIGDAIVAIGPSGFVQKNAWGFTSFFGEVFSANPKRVPAWRLLVLKQDKTVQEFLQHSFDLSESGGVLALKGHSAGLNDMFWGAFFASGNVAYVRRLIDEVKYTDERKDKALYLAGATAKWSLLSNTEQHPLVLKTLKESAESLTDKRTRKILSVMLLQGADDADRELKETLSKQKAAGIWK